MTTLRGLRIVLRPVVLEDLPALLAILREPSVARVWSEPDVEKDGALLLGKDPDGAEAITTFAITLGSELIGWIAGWEKLARWFTARLVARGLEIGRSPRL